MDREIVLDTETTGLDPIRGGHRIAEIGCLELINHVPTGKTFHVYIDPEREFDPEAAQVVGLTWDMLKGKPLFKDIARDFLAFIGQDPLVIHNATFDLKFLNFELTYADLPRLTNPVIDTLPMARKKFPGSPASLNALCKRFGVSLESRTKHGALIDSELLAKVYLELIGGPQKDMFGEKPAKTKRAVITPKSATISTTPVAAPTDAVVSPSPVSTVSSTTASQPCMSAPTSLPEPIPVTVLAEAPASPSDTAYASNLTPEEEAAHQEMLDLIPNSIWESA